MLTGKARNKMDKIPEMFWTDGITNPHSIIESENIFNKDQEIK